MATTGGPAPGYYLLLAALSFWGGQSNFSNIYAGSQPRAVLGQPDATAGRNFLRYCRSERRARERTILALYHSRFLSVLLLTMTICAVYQTLRLSEEEGVAVLATALFAVVLQILFIGAGVNYDNAITDLAALALRGFLGVL